jgi:hypothetical protein
MIRARAIGGRAAGVGLGASTGVGVGAPRVACVVGVGVPRVACAVDVIGAGVGSGAEAPAAGVREAAPELERALRLGSGGRVFRRSAAVIGFSCCSGPPLFSQKSRAYREKLKN